MTDTSHLSNRLLKKYGEPDLVEHTKDPYEIEDYENWFRKKQREAYARGATYTEAVMSLDGNTLFLYAWKSKNRNAWKQT